MIDVDIVGQLIPNPITMLTQLLSTLILFLLMKKYLWSSVKEFLAVRADKMQEDLAAGEQARSAAESDRAEAALQLKNAGTKSEEIVAAAVREAGNRKDEILADANREAEQVKNKAREQMQAEREAMYSDMQKEMVEVAMSAAGKLLAKDSGEELDRQAIDAFVKEATDGK
ncbi:MAG: F0F1 ATP synthase subunit B [Solobacterium sp.]|nr:F0F1 ATP synthase subunit B [Solobacterium sp.]